MSKLNIVYRKALGLQQNFKVADGKVYDRHENENPASPTLWKVFVEPQPNRLSCCGITELWFQSLNHKQRLDVVMKLSSVAFRELVACYIRASIPQLDHRVLVVGVPTKVGSASMYSLELYERLRPALIEFGFEEVCKPYVNQSSHNTIVVLIAQMP